MVVGGVHGPVPIPAWVAGPIDMIERFGKAVGFRLPLWRGRQAELWFLPRGAVVPPHVHRTIDSFIVYLLGRMRVTVGHTTREVCGPLRKRASTGRWILAVKHIPRGVRHCAEVVGSFAVFVNFEKCYGERTSAAADFLPVQ